MIREARREEFEAVMHVIEGALLEADPDAVRRAVVRGDALVATADGHVRGVLVLDRTYIDAIAVVRTHRAKGLGSALVEHAAERGPLTAEFRPAVRSFYESLGFEIDCREGAEGDEKRWRGRLGAQESRS